MRKLFSTLLFTSLLLGFLGLGYAIRHYQADLISLLRGSNFDSPFIALKNQELPLLQYRIPALRERKFESSQILIEELTESNNNYEIYNFSYTTMGKRMSGQMHAPASFDPKEAKVIIMLRGYVPEESYAPGVGSKRVAEQFAEAGYLTLAPDFFGFASSDPEPEDPWEARFVKPINVIELIESVKTGKIQGSEDVRLKFSSIATNNIGIWAHSNGGQIALSTLEIIDQKIPTTLWAPVTAPFPYSILYFGDELPDEGKEQRKWISLFEENYDVFDFSLTRHVNLLQGPLQIHHGSSDDAALKSWSDAFVEKINKENKRRQSTYVKPASSEAEFNFLSNNETEEIELDYFVYPGADHNLRPGSNWQQAVNRDLQFFAKHL